MLGASSVDEINEAMRDWVDPSNNFVTADVHGSIAYLNRGRLPVRPMANAWLPVPGWDGLHEWEGSVPFEEMARSRDPETGVHRDGQQPDRQRRLPALHLPAVRRGPQGAAHQVPPGAHERCDRARHGGPSTPKIVSIPALRYMDLLTGVEPRNETEREAKTAAPGLGRLDAPGRGGADNLQRLQAGDREAYTGGPAGAARRRGARRRRTGRALPRQPAARQASLHGRRGRRVVPARRLGLALPRGGRLLPRGGVPGGTAWAPT